MPPPNKKQTKRNDANNIYRMYFVATEGFMLEDGYTECFIWSVSSATEGFMWKLYLSQTPFEIRKRIRKQFWAGGEVRHGCKGER